jgi:transcriptional regulator with XRE-family HTH domain
MDIGKNIRRLREAKNLSQKEVAISLDIAPTQYSRIENNKVSPGITSIIKIAKVLDVSIDTLVYGEKNPTEGIKIKNKPLMDKMRLIDNLPTEEQNVIIKVIELALNQQKFKDFFQQNFATAS